MEITVMRTVEAFRLQLVAPTKQHAVLTFRTLPYNSQGSMEPSESEPFVLGKHQVIELMKWLESAASDMPDVERPSAQ